MESGKLRHRGMLYSPPATLTARGQVDKSAAWTSVATVRVGIRAASGGEYVRGRQVVAEATHLLTIRFRSDVQPTWKMTIDGTDYHILAVQDADDRRREMTLQAKVLA